MSAWLILFFAGVAEVIWAVAMKYAEGFMRLVPSIVTIAFYLLSAVLLSLALHRLPLGTAYAAWTGMGIVGTTILGVFLFQETLTLAQAACVLLIITGIAGLKILS